MGGRERVPWHVCALPLPVSEGVQQHRVSYSVVVPPRVRLFGRRRGLGVLPADDGARRTGLEFE